MAKRTPATKTDAGRKLAIAAARLAADDNAEDIVVLDLRGVSPVTDYFVIATGSSGRQMQSAAQHIMDVAAGQGQPVWRFAGMEGGQWIVLDFVDVVVHIFDESHRRYYDLELIWGAAPKVRWRRPAKAKPAE